MEQAEGLGISSEMQLSKKWRPVLALQEVLEN